MSDRRGFRLLLGAQGSFPFTSFRVRMTTRRRREGFALVVTLGVLVIAAVVALGGALVGRNAFDAARNRVYSERALWLARGCAESALSRIDAQLTNAPSPDVVTSVWRTLNRRIAVDSSFGLECTVSLEAAGSRWDVNDIEAEPLDALLRQLGVNAPESLRDALFDWRDADDEPRASGAEREWYANAGRDLPRNGPIASVGELARVRGFDSVGGLDAVIGVEPARVSLATAPGPVLAAVPGFTAETVQAILALQAAGTPPRELTSLLSVLSPASASALLDHFADAARVTTPDPDAWLVAGHANAGVPDGALSSVTVEWRVVRAGQRAVVVRKRTLP